MVTGRSWPGSRRRGRPRRAGAAGRIVVCAKEKSRALDRIRPIRPIRPGRPEKATHDYIRHGTTTLFAALEIATGQVTDACYPRAIATVADAPASSARTACLHAQPACLPPQQSWQATVIVT
jgi:hypothetical protein